MFDLGVEAKGLQLREEPLGIVLVVGRAYMVRARGEAAHVLADVVWLRHGAKLLLPLDFGGGVLRGVAAQRHSGAGVDGVGGAGKQQRAGDDLAHKVLRNWSYLVLIKRSKERETYYRVIGRRAGLRSPCLLE